MNEYDCSLCEENIDAGLCNFNCEDCGAKYRTFIGGA